MAVTTVKVLASGCLCAERFSINHQVCRIAGVLVIVVTHVLRLCARFMLAIRRHGCPAELNRKKSKQQDGEPTTHGRKDISGRIGTA
jgi:hypothetical protein